MSSQFIHVNSPSRKGHTHKRTRQRILSAQETVEEAMRVPAASKHVGEPQAPKLLYGVMPDLALAAAEEWAATAHHESGKQWRQDAPIMLAGVVSIPIGFPDEQWGPFQVDTIDWLKCFFGEDHLKSVIEHVDERMRHMHWFLVPRPGEAFGQLDAAYSASRTARKAPGNKIRSAYNQQRILMQDSFYDTVGSKYGLERFGPRRARRSRSAHVTIKLEEDAVLLEKQASDLRERLKAEENNAIARVKILLAQEALTEAALEKRQTELRELGSDSVDIIAAKNQQLDEAESRARELESQLRALGHLPNLPKPSPRNPSPR